MCSGGCSNTSLRNRCYKTIVRPFGRSRSAFLLPKSPATPPGTGGWLQAAAVARTAACVLATADAARASLVTQLFSPLKLVVNPSPVSKTQNFYSPTVRWDLQTAPASCAMLELVLGICGWCSTRVPDVQFIFPRFSTLSRHPTAVGTSSRRRSPMADPPESLGHRQAAAFEHWVNTVLMLNVGHVLSRLHPWYQHMHALGARNRSPSPNDTKQKQLSA